MRNLRALHLLLGSFFVADFTRVERHVGKHAWTLAFRKGTGVDDDDVFDDLNG